MQGRPKMIVCISIDLYICVLRAFALLTRLLAGITLFHSFWYIKGLSPAGEASSTQMLQGLTRDGSLESKNSESHELSPEERLAKRQRYVQSIKETPGYHE